MAFNPPATVCVKHDAPLFVNDIPACGTVSLSDDSLQQQQVDDWVIEQYFTKAVNPVDVSVNMQSRRIFRVVWKCDRRIIGNLYVLRYKEE
jgi:hypothetical protein